MDTWIMQNVSLNYFVGENTVFRKTFKMLVSQIYFTKLSYIIDSPQISLNDFSPEIDGILFRSHPIKRKMVRLRFFKNTIRYIPHQYNHYTVDFSSSFEVFLQKFSSRSRSMLKRKIKVFTKYCNGRIDWREYKTPQEMNDFFALARKISVKTYQEKLLQNGLPKTESFREEIFKMAQQNRIRGYLLFYEKIPVSYLCCPIVDDIMLYEYVGYDPEYSQWSPGIVLIYLVMEKLFQEKSVKSFDFSEGEGRHKEFWATNRYFCADIYYFKKNMSILLFLIAHMLLRNASRSLVQIMDFLGIKRWVKKRIRSSS